MLPLVQRGGGSVRFQVKLKVVRPLPVDITFKAKFTRENGSSGSGYLKPIHLGMDELCVPYPASKDQWLRLYNSDIQWTTTMKRLRSPASKSSPGSVIQVKDCGGYATTVASPTLVAMRIGKYHVLLCIDKAGVARVSTDFWPCLEYIDDYLANEGGKGRLISI
mmetsp:Transcript_1228/g.3433  ORF Transcript_1228/g.3433 Transcript_1228/m.3433 type:complete len:164 (-) Transcript_1228:1428-1919(-)